MRPQPPTYPYLNGDVSRTTAYTIACICIADDYQGVRYGPECRHWEEYKPSTCENCHLIHIPMGLLRQKQHVAISATAPSYPLPPVSLENRSPPLTFMEESSAFCYGSQPLESLKHVTLCFITHKSPKLANISRYIAICFAIV